MPAGPSGAQGRSGVQGLERRALLASPPRCLHVSLRPAACHRDPLAVCLCVHTYLGAAPSPRASVPWVLLQVPSPSSFCPLPHSETSGPGIETREGEAAVGSSLISSHGRKWRGGGPRRGPERQAWREGPSSALQPTLNAVVGGGPPPSHPSSLQLQGGPTSGTADFPGAANHLHHPPHTGKKKSSCHVTVTSCPTVVPGMFVVGYHGDGRCRLYPGSCGEENAPSS